MTSPAVAYYRTSSATNVGGDKDSLRRQQEAVRAHAAAHGLEMVGEFHDAAISGADHIGDRGASPNSWLTPSSPAPARSWSRTPRDSRATCWCRRPGTPCSKA